MRKVIAAEYVTLDGVMEGADLIAPYLTDQGMAMERTLNTCMKSMVPG